MILFRALRPALPSAACSPPPFCARLFLTVSTSTAGSPSPVFAGFTVHSNSCATHSSHSSSTPAGAPSPRRQGVAQCPSLSSPLHLCASRAQGRPLRARLPLGAAPALASAWATPTANTSSMSSPRTPSERRPLKLFLRALARCAACAPRASQWS